MKLTNPLLDSEYFRFCEIAQANRKAECFVSDEIQVFFFIRKRIKIKAAESSFTETRNSSQKLNISCLLDYDSDRRWTPDPCPLQVLDMLWRNHRQQLAL
jgi:hypothetical protein